MSLLVFLYKTVLITNDNLMVFTTLCLGFMFHAFYTGITIVSRTLF